MKNPRGRPRKPDVEKLGHRLEVRASEADKVAFQRAADNAKLDLSDWIRAKLRDAANRENGQK